MTQNCRNCRHHRVELSMMPQIVVCSIRSQQIACQSCYARSDVGLWRMQSGKIECPQCQSLQSIPRCDDWRVGYCGPQSKEVIVPLGGAIGECVDFAAIPAQVVQRGLFD